MHRNVVIVGPGPAGLAAAIYAARADLTPLVLRGEQWGGLIATTSAVRLGFVLAWLRLDTGSIWPPAVAHAAWNAVINGGFALATEGAGALLWTGESGLLVALALALVTLGTGQARRCRARAT